MKKMWIAALAISLFLTNFASAQFYGSFSIGSILNGIDDSTIVLGLIFLISFVLINFSLAKFFKGNKSVAGVIAFAVSLLIIWGLNSSGLGYTNIFYNIFFFIPSNAIQTLWPLIFLGAAVILTVRYGLWRGIGVLFIGSGSLVVLLSFTNLVYETSGGLGFGALLIIIGLGFWAWGVRKAKRKIMQINYGGY